MTSEGGRYPGPNDTEEDDMRVTALIMTAALIAAAGTAQAAKSPTEERVGVGIGVTVGALAGGPVGAIVGAAIGAKFGDNYAKKNERIEDLSASLDTKTARVGELERTVAELNRDVSVLDSDLRRLQDQARPELANLLQAGIEMDLLFHTGEHELGTDTQSRLRQLAGTLASMPDVMVRLDGFADARGGESYNRELSAKRASYIRDLLVDSGVADTRIRVNAHGEQAAGGTPDSFALDRKVSMTLFIDGASLAASNR